MSRIPVLAAALGAACASFAGNLFPRGDFDAADRTLRGDAIPNPGALSLFVEDANWNRCGRLEVMRAVTNDDGSVVFAACAFIGGDGKAVGLPVKGDTLYDFSFEVRSDSVKSVNVKFQDWKTGVWARDSKPGKTSLGKVYVRPGWSRYRGTFRTHPGATRAVLALQMWQSTQYPPVTLRIGDAVLFDNVTVEESRDLARALLSGGADAEQSKPVARTKAARSGEVFGDFLRLDPKRGVLEPMGAKTEATLTAGADALEVRVVCDEPRKVRPGTADNLWAADVLEVYFGPAGKNPDRTSTQFAWNPAGARTAFKSGVDMPEWSAKWSVETQVGKNGYTSVARIPYALLGFRSVPEQGESIRVNVCRTRAAARELGCWAPVKEKFAEVDRFGFFVFGSWNDALVRGWKAEGEKASTRDEFEAAVQRIEAARRDARFNALKGKPFTVARVSSTSDFGCPFVPSEVFEPPERIELKAAVNEVTGVPVAVMNLSGRTEEYVVRLETDTSNPAEEWRAGYNGKFGLAGLEPERVTLRRAMRFKDTEQTPCTVRLDPLSCAGDVLSLVVPPKEAGVVWIDFDLMDAKPGTYAGRLRVMPLGESASFNPAKGKGYHERQYKGAMQDVPFLLEIRPIVLAKRPARPGGFFQRPINRQSAKMMMDAGVTEFQVSPWDVVYAHDKATGAIDLTKPLSQAVRAMDDIRRQTAWAKEYGIGRPTFFVGFGCYDAALAKYGRPGLALDEKARCFGEYVKAVRHLMNGAGVAVADFNMETFDEPQLRRAPEIAAAHKAAKAAAPEVRLTLTMGGVRLPIAFFREMADTTDSWLLWDGFYFQQGEFVEFNAKQMARGKTIRHYTCSTSPRTPLYREYRLHAWFGEYHGLSADEKFWFCDDMGGMGQPDYKVTTFGSLVYRNFDTFVPSMRYMNLRQSVQDVKYLAKLREVAGSEPEVAAFLKSAPERVMVVDMHDRTAPDRMREEAARLILKYLR